MDVDVRGLLGRREILSAYIKVFERPEELLQVCAQVAGDSDAARTAVAVASDLSEIRARALLDLVDPSRFLR
ncbi:hypothetical protein [Marisediminicola antarctica]|uniref:Uncharacterized protein n=1 Tax=Marisediminicola antarctica TaxID=674079 RepID=A0A7L5AGG6_9MICO|nr:hypothetical protein [Marisediminicola antarctica]QHO69623.1 hypothetical protein BHD05_08185 [Marisediminicola antarctica]